MDFSISNQVQRKDLTLRVLLTHCLIPLVFFGPFTKLNQKMFRPAVALADVINAAVDFSNTATTSTTEATLTTGSRPTRNFVYDFNTLKLL